MEYSKGWIKLHRELLNNSIWCLSTPEQKTILITLLLLANHQNNEWEFEGQRFACKAGQFVTSINSIAEACGKGISTQNVRTALARFEKLGFLTNKSTKTGRLITINNWQDYQSEKKKGSKQYGLGYYNGKKDAEAELAESMAKEEKEKLMLTLKEAAELTGLSYSALRLMCIREEIPSHRVGKKYLINKETLLEYLKAPH